MHVKIIYARRVKIRCSGFLLKIKYLKILSTNSSDLIAKWLKQYSELSDKHHWEKCPWRIPKISESSGKFLARKTHLDGSCTITTTWIRARVIGVAASLVCENTFEISADGRCAKSSRSENEGPTEVETLCVSARMCIHIYIYICMRDCVSRRPVR